VLALTLGRVRRNLPAMAAGSLALAVVSFVCIVLGVVLAPMPGVGALFAFGAPALALAGIVIGGKAMSRDKQRGASPGFAQAGVFASTIAFVPALLTAMTCGVCNALCAGGEFSAQRHFDVQFGNAQPPSAGAAGAGSAEPPPPPAQSQKPDAPGTPPPAFPPPPIAPKSP
jgi:hypothetical protein